MALSKIRQIVSLLKIPPTGNSNVSQRTLFFTKKKTEPEPISICPPTHEEIPPPPSKFYQYLAVFVSGLILGAIVDTYGRPLYREKFPEPPCDVSVFEEEYPCAD